MHWTRKKIAAIVLAAAGLLGGTGMYYAAAPGAHTATHTQEAMYYAGTNNGPGMYYA